MKSTSVETIQREHQVMCAVLAWHFSSDSDMNRKVRNHLSFMDLLCSAAYELGMLDSTWSQRQRR